MTDTKAVYLTCDGGHGFQCRGLMAASLYATSLCVDEGHTVMVRTVYADGLTHVIIRGPEISHAGRPTLRTIGEWTYNNRGRDQEIYPDSGIPPRRPGNE